MYVFSFGALRIEDKYFHKDLHGVLDAPMKTLCAKIDAFSVLLEEWNQNKRLWLELFTLDGVTLSGI